MVYVCDAVMGSGKTTATINYINSHPEKKFIYITPYLGESDRIVDNCDMIKFETPSGKRGAAKSGKYSKLEDVRELIASGKNISSTHALFKTYDSEMLSMITEQGYILIIDENVEVTEKSGDSMDDIKNFRQVGSICAGHPEYGVTEGVDCSSGPLGQGLGHAVGMAMAEKFLEEKFNKEDIKLFDNYTYCLIGDGDIEEGVTFESANIASRLNLNKLIVLYDKNNCTLDDNLDVSLNEDVKARFEALKWNVLEVDGLNEEEVLSALNKAKEFKNQPTIIICNTIMGYLATNQGTHKVHGSPLKDDLDVVKSKINWTYKPFEIPEEVYTDYAQNGISRGHKKYELWEKNILKYSEKYPNEFNEYLEYRSLALISKFNPLISTLNFISGL